jgi:large subunit ribosomal protein L20
MARTARSLHARKKRRKVLEEAKGYRGTKHSSYKRAKEQVWKSGVYAYEGRKQRKRDFRSLWIQRINAGAREHDISYSQLIHGLKLAEIDLNRKILADIAVAEPEVFTAVVTQAKNALEGNPVERRVKIGRSAEPEQPRPGARTKAEPAEGASTEATVDTSGEPEKDEATEAAKRRADELDVNLSEVEGSGAEGRVLHEGAEEAADEEGKVHATDAAERKAEELGVDLSTVEGTGQGGRITVGDVEKAAREEG